MTRLEQIARKYQGKPYKIGKVTRGLDCWFYLPDVLAALRELQEGIAHEIAGRDGPAGTIRGCVTAIRRYCEEEVDEQQP